MKPAVLSIVGKKGSGKSEVLENLISHFKDEGWKMGAIKQMAKVGLEIDQPGKDTYRYRKSGAETVILSGQRQLAIFSDIDEETPLEELLHFFEGYDLVFLEGYLLDSIMKIEVVEEYGEGDLLTKGMPNVLVIHSSKHPLRPLVSLVESWLAGARAYA